MYWFVGVKKLYCYINWFNIVDMQAEDSNYRVIHLENKKHV